MSYHCPVITNRTLAAFIVITAISASIFAWANARPRVSEEVIKAQELKELDIYEAVKDKATVQKLIERHGQDKVMAKLLEESGNGELVDCHQEAHTIGRVAYTLFKEEAFTKTSYECHSGYLHGAMEGFLNEEGTADIARSVNKVCGRFDTQFKKFECLHGVGHGILAYEDYDLPKALDKCEELGDWFAKRSCYGGVFMENVVTGQGQGSEGYHQTSWLSSDPLFPCNKVKNDPDIKYECYQMQTSRILYLNNYDFADAAKTCGKVEKSMQTPCFRSIGRDAAGHTLRDTEKTLSYCSEVPEGHYIDCISGALNVIIDFWGPNLSDQAKNFCNKITDENAKSACLYEEKLRASAL